MAGGFRKSTYLRPVNSSGRTIEFSATLRDCGGKSSRWATLTRRDDRREVTKLEGTSLLLQVCSGERQRSLEPLTPGKKVPRQIPDFLRSVVHKAV